MIKNENYNSETCVFTQRISVQIMQYDPGYE